MSCKNLLSGSLAALYNGVGDFVAPNPMRKTKFEDRIDNAVNAFFDAEPDRSRLAMTYTGYDASLVADERPFTVKADKWLNILREIFMFGPGTFALFYLTVTYAFNFPGVGTNLYTYVFAIFLTYAGSGSIRNLRNLAVPASIIALAFAIVSISTMVLGHDVAADYFWNSIYLLPFVLVVAKLVQSWVGDK